MIESGAEKGAAAVQNADRPGRRCFRLLPGRAVSIKKDPSKGVLEAVEGSRTLVSSLEGWGNEPLYDYRKIDDMIIKLFCIFVNSFGQKIR